MLYLKNAASIMQIDPLDNILHQDMLYHNNIRAMPQENPYGNWAGLFLVLMYTDIIVLVIKLNE